jgi:hypothetical protein
VEDIDNAIKEATEVTQEMDKTGVAYCIW